MIAAALAPFVLAALVGATAAGIARTCAPRWAAVALVAAALLAALATGLVLCAVALLGLAELPVFGRAGHWSPDVLSDRVAVPWPLAVAAAVVAVALLARAGRQLLRSTARFVAAARTCRAAGPGSGGLVVVADERARAVAVPGSGGRILLTSGLLRRLDARERRAVLAHEAAHLGHRHFVHVQLAELAAAANPMLRPVVGAVRLAVECWADEDALRTVGDPLVVARAIAKAGIGRAGRDGLVLAAGDTDLACRVRRLTGGRPRRVRWAVAALVAAALSAGCATVVASDTHEMMETAQAGYR